MSATRKTFGEAIKPLFLRAKFVKKPWEDSVRIASSFTTVRKTIGNHHDRPAAPAGSDPEWHSVSHVARRSAQASRPDYVGRRHWTGRCFESNARSRDIFHFVSAATSIPLFYLTIVLL